MKAINVFGILLILELGACASFNAFRPTVDRSLNAFRPTVDRSFQLFRPTVDRSFQPFRPTVDRSFKHLGQQWIAVFKHLGQQWIAVSKNLDQQQTAVSSFRKFPTWDQMWTAASKLLGQSTIPDWSYFSVMVMVSYYRLIDIDDVLIYKKWFVIVNFLVL